MIPLAVWLTFAAGGGSRLVGAPEDAFERGLAGSLQNRWLLCDHRTFVPQPLPLELSQAQALALCKQYDADVVVTGKAVASPGQSKMLAGWNTASVDVHLQVLDCAAGGAPLSAVDHIFSNGGILDHGEDKACKDALNSAGIDIAHFFDAMGEGWPKARSRAAQPAVKLGDLRSKVLLAVAQENLAASTPRAWWTMAEPATKEFPHYVPPDSDGSPDPAAKKKPASGDGAPAVPR